MNRTSRHTGLAAAAPGAHFPANLKRLSGWVLVVLLMALWPARAESPDDQYLRIYGLIEQADALAAKGQAAPALAKYREAQFALHSFQKDNLDWNTKLVAYRFKYLADQVAALSAKPSAPAGTPPAQPGAKGAASASTLQVKLLEPGTEPRKVLRLHPKPGDKQAVTLSMKTATEIAMGEMPSQAIKMPRIKLTWDLTVKSVSAEGDIAYELIVRDASVAEEPGTMPQVAEALTSTLAKIKGISGAGTMSDHGFSQGLEMKVPPGADPKTRQVIDQMKELFYGAVVPLPEEAAGVGARWEAKMPIKSQGMTIDQTTTCELVSIEGERLVVKSAVAQHAANQKMQLPTMPGLKLDLKKMTGKGAGETTVDLGQLLPSAATADLHSDLSLGMNTGGQTQSMTMKTDMNLRLEAK